MYTHTCRESLPKTADWRVGANSSQSASSVLCLGFDTNPHSMGAHSTTWGVRVCGYKCVCICAGYEYPIHHLFVNTVSQTPFHFQRVHLDACVHTHECFPVRVYVHMDLYLQCVIHSAFHMKLFLINQFMEGQLYEPRLSSTPSQWNLIGLFFFPSSSSHNPPSGQIRSYTVTRKPQRGLPARAKHMLWLFNFSAELLWIYILHTLSRYCFYWNVKITISFSKFSFTAKFVQVT